MSQKTELLRLSQHKTLGDRIIVVPVEIKQTGITADIRQYEERPEIGLVVSVGGHVSEIKEGDVIFFSKYANDTVTHDGTAYIVIREEDVYCIAQE